MGDNERGEKSMNKWHNARDNSVIAPTLPSTIPRNSNCSKWFSDVMLWHCIYARWFGSDPHLCNYLGILHNASVYACSDIRLLSTSGLGTKQCHIQPKLRGVDGKVLPGVGVWRKFAFSR